MPSLWIIDSSVIVSTEIAATSRTTWDLSWENSLSDDGGAIENLKKIIMRSMSTPGGIYQDLIFPDIEFDLDTIDTEMLTEYGINIRDTMAPDDLEANIKLPALRPTLQCTPASHSNISVAKDEYGSLYVTYALTNHCPGNPNSNQSILQTIPTSNVTNNIWVGRFLDLDVGLGDENVQNHEGSSVSAGGLERHFSQVDKPDKPDECPSLAVVFGYVEGNKLSPENMTALFCSQEIQQVQANVPFRFKMSRPQSFTRFKPNNLRSPVATDETTAVFLTTRTQSDQGFHFHVCNHFDDLQWDDMEATFGHVTGTNNFDAFWKFIVINLEIPEPIEKMLGPDNSKVIADVVNRMYKKYMALVINSPIFRKRRNNSQVVDAEERFQGSLTGTIQRLKCDYASKVILQIVLALMTALEALAIRLSGMKGTLPRVPYSIASVMALFADSNLCDQHEFLKGAEWMRAAELENLFGELRFGLGWWDTKDRPIRGTQDVESQTDWQRTSRFGIDVGVPKTMGYKKGVQPGR